MPWLRSGSVSCTLNSTTVTGTGTGFVANARVGDAFLGPDGRWYEVANIASDTALSILPAYLGATVSAGAYALAPMQGYVKDSADQLRTLVNKFGTLAAAASINALAALTGAANKIAYFTAADQMALADFPAQARTLLAATTIAAQRSALGLGTAAVAPLVGTVSQASGVATGAIVETGTNANGTYTKFADGTMICRGSTVGLDQTTTSQAYSLTATFPAAFISTAYTVEVNVISVNVTNVFQGYCRSGTGTASTFSVIQYWNYVQTYTYTYMAIGRWF